MGEQMAFPDTWEEFEKSYGFADKEQIYTNGSRLIQSFRVEQWLDHLPSAQQWIPCAEKLPENNEDVLCCSYTGNFLIGTLYKSGPNIAAVTGYGAESDWEIMLNCIAWMPLPEPYRR